MNGKKIWVMFLAGLVLGGAAGYWGAARRGPSWGRHGGKHHERMMDRFSRRLALTPEQREKMSSLFAVKREKIHALHEEFRPRFEALRADAREDIRALLSPEQNQRFDKMTARWEKRRGAPPPPPPGP